MIEIKADNDSHIRIPEDQDVRIAYTKSFFEKTGFSGGSPISSSERQDTGTPST